MSKKVNDNLLREAIAEANQVRNAAIANAKAALEEAFAPHFSSMLTSKLRNEMQDDAEDGYGRSAGEEPDFDVVMANEQKALKSSDINSTDNKMPAAGARTSSDIDNPGQEVDKMCEATVPHDGHDPEGEDVTKRKSTYNAHGNLHKEHGNQFAHANRSAFDAMYEDDFEDEEEEDELGFDVDDDGGAFDAPGGEGGDDAGLDFFGDEDEEEDEFGGEEDEFGDEEGGLGGIDLDLEAIIRELEQELRGGGAEEPEFEMDEDISKAAKALPAKTSMEQDPAGSPSGEKRFVKLGENDLDESDEEEIDLDEMLDEMGVHGFGDDAEELRSENVALKRDLKEHRDVVRFLKGRLEEMSVLNGKLLYTNRLFKNYNLNSGQKMRVVENFDRAGTLREVKLVYTTLAEAFSGTPTKSSTKKMVSEGLASRPVGSTKPKTQQPAILEEGDALVRRFQKIAGITRNLNS